MAYCDFDLDIFQVDRSRFPHYDRKKINKRAVYVFLGKEKASNQFGSDRIVLYRCHCGCDYCGVISFELQIEADLIIWKDIRYEEEDGLGSLDRKINVIKELRFDRAAYQLEFEKYLKECLV